MSALIKAPSTSLSNNMERKEIPQSQVDDLYSKLIPAAERKGYKLNPDEKDAKELIRSLIDARNKYGYMCCPCRMAAKDIKVDSDIICPCIYREPDIAEYGTCYCTLYVSPEVASGEKPLQPIPERRPARSLCD